MFDLQLKTAGMVRPIRPAIVRGETDVSKFAMCHLVDDETVMAVEKRLMAAAQFMAGKGMIAAATHVDPDLLGDESVNLRNVLRDELKTTKSP